MAELAVARARGAEGARIGRDVAGDQPLLHPVVAGVGGPEVAFGIGRDAHRMAEATLALAGVFGAELGDVFTALVELLDAVVAFVADPNVALGVDRDRIGVFELGVAGAFG